MKGGQNAAAAPPKCRPRPPPPRRAAAPRRHHTEPCFMERNRTDVATLETLRLHIRARQCATHQCACALRYASALCLVPVLALARLGYAVFAPFLCPVFGLLVLRLPCFVPFASLQMTKSDKKICRNIYVICNITYYKIFSSPLKYLFTKHPISGMRKPAKGASQGHRKHKRASPASKSASAQAGQRQSRKCDEVAKKAAAERTRCKHILWRSERGSLRPSER